MPDALTAEAMAAKEGIELAMEVGVGNLILEMDNLVLKIMLESNDGARHSIGGLWLDIRELGSFFSVVFAHHCARKA